MSSVFVDVVVNRPFWTPYTYSVSSDILPKGELFGMRVKIPLLRRNEIGWIVGSRSSTSLDVAIEKIKEVSEVVDNVSPFPCELVRLMRWVGGYYFSPMGMLLASAFPPNVPRVVESVKCRTSESAVRKPIVLMEPRKTRIEHYIDMIKNELSIGKQVIVMFPDRNLVDYFYGRLKGAVLEDMIAVWTTSRIRKEWLSVRDGNKKIVLGSRFVVFAPVNNLSLIIVDEESSESYWQNRVPFYNARDVAIRRAAVHRCKVILGDSLPLVETVYKAVKHFYVFDRKREIRRFGPKKIRIVDMRISGREGVISNYVMDEIERVLNRDRQSILFVNRRGYAGFIICGDCGFVPRCPNCSVSLTFYKEKFLGLKCNYCGYTERVPDVCPVCGGINWLTYSAGVEQISDALSSRFPGNSIAYLDSDLKKKEIVDIVSNFKKGKVKILVSTVLFMSYLLDHQVDRIFVIYADALFNMPDFRSGERGFRILDRLLGFLKKDGRLILQTFNPSFPVIRFFSAQQKWRFYRYELANRKELLYPPFSYIAVVELKGKEDAEVKSMAERIRVELSKYEVSVLGPVRPIVSKLRGYYRWRLVLKDLSWTKLHDLIREKYYD
ncbi:MAG: primosomal protein N', partial [Synergistetes bacterium]|nr:primosomal protein N' [Synergistota bacterium]